MVFIAIVVRLDSSLAGGDHNLQATHGARGAGVDRALA
jgi:hypothetical protein